jgi:hypothetical protein
MKQNGEAISLGSGLRCRIGVCGVSAGGIAVERAYMFVRALIRTNRAGGSLVVQCLLPNAHHDSRILAHGHSAPRK